MKHLSRLSASVEERVLKISSFLTVSTSSYCMYSMYCNKHWNEEPAGTTSFHCKSKLKMDGFRILSTAKGAGATAIYFTMPRSWQMYI
jgi:hypothetical protein